MGPRRRPATSILLKGRNSEMIPNDILLHPKRRTLLSPHLRSSFSGWWLPETHTGTMCRAWETSEHSALNVMALSNPSPQDSGICGEEETKRLWKPEVGVTRGTTSSRHSRSDRHMSSQTGAACTNPAQLQTRQKSSTEKTWTQNPKKQFAINTC